MTVDGHFRFDRMLEIKNSEILEFGDEGVFRSRSFKSIIDEYMPEFDRGSTVLDTRQERSPDRTRVRTVTEPTLRLNTYFNTWKGMQPEVSRVTEKMDATIVKLDAEIESASGDHKQGLIETRNELVAEVKEIRRSNGHHNAHVMHKVRNHNVGLMDKGLTSVERAETLMDKGLTTVEDTSVEDTETLLNMRPSIPDGYDIYVLGESSLTILGGELDGVTQGDGSHLVGKVITINSGAWSSVSIIDDDLNFEDNDDSQTLDGDQQIDGVSFSNGDRVEAEYAFEVTDGTNTWTMVSFNVTNSDPAYGTVEGIAVIDGPGGFPPEGVPLTVVRSQEFPSFAAADFARPVDETVSMYDRLLENINVPTYEEIDGTSLYDRMLAPLHLGIPDAVSVGAETPAVADMGGLAT